MKLPSASGIDDALKCPTRVLLETEHTTNEAAERGTWCHSYLERVGMGLDTTVFMWSVPEEYRTWLKSLDVAALFAGRKNMQFERPYAFNVASGLARVLASGGQRDYSDRRPDEFVGTIDVIGQFEDGAWFVDDYKTGATLGDPSTKMQLRWAAMCLANHQKITDDIHVGYTYINVDSTFYRPPFGKLGVWDHDDTLQTLRQLRDRIAAAHKRIGDGQIPETTTGDHCRYCRGWIRCPSKAGLLRNLMGMDINTLADLEATDIADIWDAYMNASQVTERLKPIVNEYLASKHIALPDGRSVRLVASSKSSFSTGKLVDLATKLGATPADISSAKTVSSFSYPKVTR